jgi:malate permease and related proteins
MLQLILHTIYQITVPLAIPVISGALLKYFKNLETKPLLTLYLYFLSPAIILDTLSTAQISVNDIYKTTLYCLLNLIILWLTASIIGKFFKLDQSDTAALTLVSTLTNSVNYGLPLVILAFGQIGLNTSSVYIVAQMILVNTMGIYFAARSQFSIRNSIKTIFSLPAIHAAMIAIILRIFNFEIPEVLHSGISMVALAYSPIVLAILGAQMISVKNTKLCNNDRFVFLIGITIRLIVAPIVAILCLLMLRIQGTLFMVLFILSCMPVAVNAGILAERFSASFKIVSKCILWTTLASFIILPILIVLIKQNY